MHVLQMLCFGKISGERRSGCDFGSNRSAEIAILQEKFSWQIMPLIKK